MLRPILSRRADLAYLVFFATHIPILLCADLAPFYPEAVKPRFLDALRTWYVDGYHDRFFMDPPAWFSAFVVLEAVLHLPLSAWAVGALLRDDPTLPIPLLVFATNVATTTFTCLVEMSSWDHISASQKLSLGSIYGPYLALALLMGADMYLRLMKQLGGSRRPGLASTAARDIKTD